jgi:hypothetical protein
MTDLLNSAPPTGKVEGGRIQFNQRQIDRSRCYIQNQDRIGTIKDALDVRDVLRDDGIDVPAADGKKFPSPLRADRNPSCTIWKGKITDWSTGETLDVIDLYAALHNCSRGQAIAALYARVCGGVVEKVSLGRRICRLHRGTPDAEAAEEWEAKERKRRQDLWGRELRTLTAIDRGRLSESRDVSEEAVERTAEQGNVLALPGVDWADAWVITNVERDNAQARRIAGGLWPSPINAKAKTLPGSFGSHPIVGDLKGHHAIAFVEGGPDFLSANHFAIQLGIEDLVCPVAMLGAGMNIPNDHLAQFAGHRVRIFIHDDDAGKNAAERWAAQLQKVGCIVDGFSFDGLVQADGEPVQDLNDLCRVHPACLESEPSLIEAAFSFATEDN